jgi:hypothetical protein
MAVGQHHRARDQLLDDEWVGTIKPRRRNSSINAAAIAVTLVVASATGSSHSRIPRLCAGAKSAKPNASRRASSCSVAGLEATGIGRERVWLDAELPGDEAEGFERDQLARPQQPAGIAQGTELQGEAEPVAIAAAADSGEVGGAQSPMPNQVTPTKWANQTEESRRNASERECDQTEPPKCRVTFRQILSTSTVSILRPCDAVVSAQAAPRDRIRPLWR